VTLVDAQQAVLGPFTADSQEYAKRILEDRGVTVRLGTTVKEVTEDCVAFGDGSKLASTLVIWAGGLRAAALSHGIATKTGPGGRLDVNDDLTISGHPQVYALGDFANMKDENGVYLPQLGAVAQQAGKHCASNIIAEESGSERNAFKYRDKGIMAMIGRNAAVAELGTHHLPISGPLAFATWLGVHAALLTSFRAELEAMIEWSWDYARGIPMNPIRVHIEEELQTR
jgi:NADH dehydrogenase